jgi:hypothetical protein
LANALNFKNFGYPEALAEATKDDAMLDLKTFRWIHPQ